MVFKISISQKVKWDENRNLLNKNNILKCDENQKKKRKVSIKFWRNIRDLKMDSYKILRKYPS